MWVIDGRRRHAALMMAAGGAVAVVMATAVARGTYQPPRKTAQSIAARVGGHYGDAHPRLVHVDSMQTDNPPHDPMYVITVAGHFRHGQQIAHYIGFSALANKTYVWAIFGYNRPGAILWSDRELEPLPR